MLPAAKKLHKEISMSRAFRIAATFASLVFAAAAATAQTTPAAGTPAPSGTPAPTVARRPASPPGTAATQVGGSWTKQEGQDEPRYTGGKWIEVTYSRPILRGRADIFGTGADYGKKVTGDAPLWRVGANATTRLKTEVPLEIGGKRLAPGEYSMFVDLKPGAWTLVLSNQPMQAKYDENEKTATWGSYNYDPKYDVVRVPMKLLTPAVSVDQFTIAFVDMSEQGGKLAMAWGKQAAAVDFKVVS
jgi:hypothetical protein